jgi:hypothetical protein
MRLHARQFFIGPSPLSVDETWQSVEIEGGLHLSYQRALPVTRVHDRDGAEWHILGIALQSDPERPDPDVEIAASRSSEVDTLTSTWSGRWILLGQGLLRPDACLFGCYYARDPHGEALLVSSSPALLQQQTGAEQLAPSLEWRVGMEWYPPPASRIAGVRRLLPSQVLAYGGEGPIIRARRLVRRPFEAPYEQTLSFLETSLRTVLRRLVAVRPGAVLALTGGYDTRVLLAASSREGLEFPTFTWDIPGMSEADRTLPPLLARDAGRRHRMIGRRRFAEDNLALLEQHTALHNADLDRQLVPWGQYDDLGSNATIILGNLFAIAAVYFYGKLPASPKSVAESIERTYHFAENHPGSTAHYEGIREWAAWIEAHPEPGMDWRDRFTWEQWMAGWCAAAEQGTEVVEVECISPANCEAMLAAMLSIDPGKRPGKRWQVDLTYRMAPLLTDHPYSLGGTFVDQFRREAAAGRTHPSKRRFLVGRTRSLVARTRSGAP